MIIAISGKPGSGKSTVAKLLAKKLGYKHYSAGNMQREIAKERGLTILQLGKLESKNDKLDRLIDKKQEQLGKQKDNFVIDAWLAARFIPHAFKVLLDVNINEAVRRRLNQKRKEEEYETKAEAKAHMKQRELINRTRWLRYYDFDYAKKSNYDVVISTTRKKPEAVADQIIKMIKKKRLL